VEPTPESTATTRDTRGGGGGGGEGREHQREDARVAAAGQKQPRKARGYFVPRRRPARALRRRGG